MNALWLAFFHNKTTVRLRPSKHLHEHREAAHLGEHLPLVGQRLLTAINTLSTWNRDPWWLSEQKCNCLENITDNMLWGIRCQGLCYNWKDLRIRDQRKIMNGGFFGIFFGHLAGIFFLSFFFFLGVLCRPLLLLPSIFPSIKVFSNESALCIGWPKYWSFSFSISPSNEYSGLISFRIDSSVLESDYPG